MASNQQSRFETRFPFRLREAMEWVASVHAYVHTLGLNLGVGKVLIPTQIEEKGRGCFRVFFSGGLNVWVDQEGTQGHYGEQWSVTKVRATWPTDDCGGKGEKVWEGDTITDLCQFHPANAR